MRRFSYRDQDFAFGQAMLTLRTTMRLTQTGLAEYLGVSRRAVGAWEAGSKYPKAGHLKAFIELAFRQRAFHPGEEGEEIRALWRASHQKVLLDERWLEALFAPSPAEAFAQVSPVPTQEQRRPPPPRSQPTRLLNLPFQATPFVGRSAEIGEISRILSDPACRLLTLLGPGGVGKTRLALEVATRQADTFEDGVAFVPLAPVSSPDQIVFTIGDTLRLSFGGNADPTAYLLDHLRERNFLLVLDNFEHLLDGADLVYEILQHAPRVTMLVSSRARLNLQAEWLFDVEGLAYPTEEQTRIDTPHSIADTYSAVKLFVQRVTQVQPGFSLSESTLATTVSICQRVAGMPLALELAAASVRIMPIAEIDRQIRSNLDVLATSFRDIPARHRSMRAVFDHSWNLLTEPERTLFSRLAVFRGGCSVEAAERITGATVQALTTLVSKSLLREVSEPKAGVEPRFILLEPIREYALSKLAAREEGNALQIAHAAYFLSFAENVAEHWDSPVAEAAIDQLDHDYDNMRAALQWARDGGDLTIGLRLSAALRKFWQRRGYYSEGRVWLEELLALDSRNNDSVAITARLQGMHTAAWLASDQHDYPRATQLFEESMALRRALGETGDETSLLAPAARQARAEGDYRRAIALLEDALARHRALRNRGSMSTGGFGQSLYDLALVHREQGNFERAVALFNEGIDFHREIGEREGIAQGLMGLGDVSRDLGDSASARDYSAQSLTIARELGIQWEIGFALNNLAQAGYLDGSLTDALSLADESVGLFRRINAEASLAEVLITIGYIFAARGNLDDAHAALTEALQFARALGPQLMVAASLEALACTLLQQERVPTSVRLISAASALRARMGTPVRPADEPILQHTVAAARAALGEDVFTATWSEAATLPLDQIISDVLGVPLGTDDEPPTNAVQIETPSPLPPLDDDDFPVFDTPAREGTRVDWGQALAIPNFYGRDSELAILTDWVLEKSCQVVSILGLGGIGKSALAVKLMHGLTDQFEVVIWRSLRDIPTCETLLDDLLRVLASDSSVDLSASVEERLGVLIQHMQRARILLVLDNLESVLEEREGSGRMRPGYEGFGRFLRKSAETEHRSCVVITSREKPVDLALPEGSRTTVRVLRLHRLDTYSCERLLSEKDVTGTAQERARLIEAYGGNPLALKIVSQTIVDLFDGEIALFLEQGAIIFGSVRVLLAEQFVRLTLVEQRVLLWLAILREPSTLNELLGVLVTPVPRARLLEAVEALRRRSLIERGQKKGSFTLQSVVLEYVTARLIEEAANEIQAGKLALLIEHGLELAQVHEYVRQTQERLIVVPVLISLQKSDSHRAELEAHLLALLSDLTTRAEYEQGYAPANLVVLLRVLRGNLRGLNLTRLALRGVYLQGVEMQDTTLTDAHMQDSAFTETFDAMIGVAVSGNGEYWAASSRGGEVRVWDAGGLTLRRAWRAHADMVWALAFSPDSRTLASGSWDGTVKLWEVTSGALLWSGRHTSHVNGIVFSPDGKVIASSGNDALVRLWDARSGAQLEVLSHPDLVIPISWSPDGQYIATGDLKGLVRLWEIRLNQTARCVLTLEAHASYVDGLAFSPAGEVLASGSWDGTVKLWELPEGTLRKTLSGHTDRISRVLFSPDGRVLASSSRDQTIRLWDVEREEYRAVLHGHTAGVCGLAFTPDSSNLLNGSEDGTMRVWDLETTKCIRVMRGYAASLYDIDWSPDGSQLVSGGSDALITIYPVNHETPPRVFSGHSGIVFRVGWSADGHWIASSEWDNSIRLWDASTGNCMEIIRHPDDTGNFFYGLAFSPDGQRLASGTYGRGVQVFRLASQARRWIERDFSTWLGPIMWSPDGSHLAGGGNNGTVYVWDADGETLRQSLVGHHSTIMTVAWSPSGRQIASGCRGREGGELFVWNAGNGNQIGSLQEPSSIVSAVAWGASDAILISGSGDGTLSWWDVERGTQLWQREAHLGTVQSIRTSPDRTMLASCGDDGAIMLWNLETGEHLKTLRRDRPYERLNITGIRGLTEAQRASLRALGAIENANP